jgi:hypothetical protein
MAAEPSCARLGAGLAGLHRIVDAETRSISPENPTGERGKGGMADEGTGAAFARDLGRGWKVSPSVRIAAGETIDLASIEGSGMIQHIWMVPINAAWRNLILRFYWDGQERPSAEVPLGDFFACGWGTYAHVNSEPVCVNPGRAFNSYWPMPFASAARITMENRDEVEEVLYYQITYALCDTAGDGGRFHASFHRSDPTGEREPHVILAGVAGRGHYVGTYLAWGTRSNGWWGEGEVKFYIDDDEEYPTICGTGTEDYFCGAYNFDIGTAESAARPHAYTEYSTAFSGLPQVIRPDGVYGSQQRFGMYRWHVLDPIRFRSRLRVTIQALGWRPSKKDGMSGHRYLPLRDDVASTAFWYQELPGSPLRPLQSPDELQII